MLTDVSHTRAGELWHDKMYHAEEVLSKFPIMQHFLFSSLLPFPS